MPRGDGQAPVPGNPTKGVSMRSPFRRRMTSSAVRIGAVAGIAIAAAGSLAMRQAPATAAHHHASAGLSISKQYFGSTIEPYTGKLTPTYRYTLSNSRGLSANILTYGAITQSITAPSRSGREADVTLGFKTLADYIKFVSPPVIAGGGPYFGETIGRYGNRIAKGTFKLNGKTYTLPINNGVNSLHGGLVGFGNHIWGATEANRPGSVGVRLTLVSPNGDASGAAGSPGSVAACTGYPAQLPVVVTY